VHRTIAVHFSFNMVQFLPELQRLLSEMATLPLLSSKTNPHRAIASLARLLLMVKAKPHLGPYFIA
jgi:hypothetical protein